MISISDYDSGFQIGKPVVKRLEKMSGILIDQLNSVPIYFVKRETIDHHDTPLCLNRECIMEIIERYKLEHQVEISNFINIENIRKLMESARECLGKCDTIACYIADDDNISKGPHILVCHEKIRHSNKKQFEDLLIEVILHELAHAYFSSGTELKDISKHIIEESLCEAYAFSRFENFNNIYDFMTDPKRPPEYTAFKFWNKIIEGFELVISMADWRSRKYRLLIIYLQTYRRFYILYNDEFYRYFIQIKDVEGLATLLLLFS